MEGGKAGPMRVSSTMTGLSHLSMTVYFFNDSTTALICSVYHFS